ncbi:hypothetical protein BG53_09095 [Paenibacillus darwinianus]|uniref:Uncharacterized protein n=1 Tax=Paenibacillus darwinianus TaxID=1380763 RepID=A0A9W5RZ30_9BACL|nr:hypothetical protein [Paenibacillus darwinianus]EXX84694.1 hypothetical protein CH50_11125 [Paenibacillus darwinianus]EXX85185.1 hypothetical protein BG52_08965 [Paenibacillus darwinianus]EXX85250.1 hypothetical protein BG53_09095 [Paenibacillus darwinianus]
MPTIYDYAAQIKNQASAREAHSLVVDIVEGKIITPHTGSLYWQKLQRLRDLGEDQLADTLNRDFAHKF